MIKWNLLKIIDHANYLTPNHFLFFSLLGHNTSDETFKNWLHLNKEGFYGKL